MYLVYILECADGSLYTGITNDLEKRLIAHNSGKNGARYTRGRRPVRLVYSEGCKDRGDALKREAVLKKLSRAEKLRLIASMR
jgi:putative endonuclease